MDPRPEFGLARSIDWAARAMLALLVLNLLGPSGWYERSLHANPPAPEPTSTHPGVTPMTWGLTEAELAAVTAHMIAEWNSGEFEEDLNRMLFDVAAHDPWRVGVESIWPLVFDQAFDIAAGPMFAVTTDPEQPDVLHLASRSRDAALQCTAEVISSEAAPLEDPAWRASGLFPPAVADLLFRGGYEVRRLDVLMPGDAGLPVPASCIEFSGPGVGTQVLLMPFGVGEWGWFSDPPQWARCIALSALVASLMTVLMVTLAACLGSAAAPPLIIACLLAAIPLICETIVAFVSLVELCGEKEVSRGTETLLALLTPLCAAAPSSATRRLIKYLLPRLKSFARRLTTSTGEVRGERAIIES